MAGLLEIQDLIYAIYAKTKGEGKRLTRDEKKKLELNIKVGKGSTDINIDITEVLKNMTGEQILIGIGIVSIAWVLVKLVSGIMGNLTKVKLAEIEQRKALEEEKTKKELYHTFENIFESAVDFRDSVQRKLVAANPETITINGTTLTPAEIEQANPPAKRTRHEETDEVIRGHFRIARIDIDESKGTFIDVVHLESKKEISHVNILADYLSKSNYQWIMDAVEDGKGKPVFMHIIARMKNDQVLHAYLQSFDNL